MSTGLLERVEMNEVYQGLKTPGHNSSENQVVGRALSAVVLILYGPLKEADGVLNVAFPLLYR